MEKVRGDNRKSRGGEGNSLKIEKKGLFHENYSPVEKQVALFE
jgi:hypothetical protein